MMVVGPTFILYLAVEKSMKRNVWLFLVIAVLAALAWVNRVSAQAPTPSDDDVNAVARQLFCPVCENTPLDVCPTQACAEWRELIRDELAQGWNEQQIKDYFVQRFGPRVLGTPPASGINWLVYVAPFLIFLAGAYLLFRAYQGFRR